MNQVVTRGLRQPLLITGAASGLRGDFPGGQRHQEPLRGCSHWSQVGFFWRPATFGADVEIDPK